MQRRLAHRRVGPARLELREKLAQRILDEVFELSTAQRRCRLDAAIHIVRKIDGGSHPEQNRHVYAFMQAYRTEERTGGDRGVVEARVKFGDFLFPDSRDPERDGAVIDETLREALLADELGCDAIWLAEHHFDGICAYADPIGFAGALAATLRHAKIGFAVVQTALHHPIRLAEQIAVIDNLTKGRLIVGLGRGSSYNIYDYQGFGIDHREAQARLDEAEEILVLSLIHI